MVEAVLTLPDHAAAITRPCSTATSGHLPDLDEVAHGRHDEHLVRQRVHEFAEIRDLVVVAGDVAVHEIREARDHEHAEGGAARIGEIQIQDHKKYGDERHPRKGELIGSRHL